VHKGIGIERRIDRDDKIPQPYRRPHMRGGGPGERGGVAQEADGFAVGDDGPLVVWAGVEEFLRQLKWRLFAGAAVAANGLAIGVAHAKACVGLVQALGVWRNHDGQLSAQTIAGDVGHRVMPVTDADAGAGTHGWVSQRVAQQLGHKSGGDVRGVQVGTLHLFVKVLPLGGCNLEGAAVFVLLL
jgi:hypothetical protein